MYEEGLFIIYFFIVNCVTVLCSVICISGKGYTNVS